MTEDYERGGVSGGGDGRTAQSRMSTKLYMEEEKESRIMGSWSLRAGVFVCLFFERQGASEQWAEREREYHEGGERERERERNRELRLTRRGVNVYLKQDSCIP